MEGKFSGDVKQSGCMVMVSDMLSDVNLQHNVCVSVTDCKLMQLFMKARV